jgi:hypothetical protein
MYLNISMNYLNVLVDVSGARVNVVGSGIMLQAGRSPVRLPDEVEFFQFT